jgi:hypothetical protein
VIAEIRERTGLDTRCEVLGVSESSALEYVFRSAPAGPQDWAGTYLRLLREFSREVARIVNLDGRTFEDRW